MNVKPALIANLNEANRKFWDAIQNSEAILQTGSTNAAGLAEPQSLSDAHAYLQVALDQRELARAVTEEAPTEINRAAQLLCSKQEELKRAVEAEEAGSIDDAPALARARFDADAQAAAAGRRLKTAEASLAEKRSCLAKAESDVKRLAKEVLARQVRAEFEKLRTIETARVSIRTRLIGAFEIAPDALSAEEWHAVDRGSAVPVEVMALHPLPSPAVQFGEDSIRGGLPIGPRAVAARNQVIEAETQWLEYLASLSGFPNAAAAGLTGPLAEIHAVLVDNAETITRHIGSINGAKSANQ